MSISLHHPHSLSRYHARLPRAHLADLYVTNERSELSKCMFRKCHTKGCASASSVNQHRRHVKHVFLSNTRGRHHSQQRSNKLRRSDYIVLDANYRGHLCLDDHIVELCCDYPHNRQLCVDDIRYKRDCKGKKTPVWILPHERRYSLKRLRPCSDIYHIELGRADSDHERHRVYIFDK